jgi:hypothetical protein
MLIAYRIFQAADQRVALCTHAAEMAVQFVVNKALTAGRKAALWRAVAVALAILINVAIFLHVVSVFAVCTVIAHNQVYVV